MLKALEGWERKMSAIGVIDYIGLTSALTLHLDKLHPAYTNILVDEAQDFGTTELNVVRRLVKPASNDIFLCGDIAQTILPKHQFGGHCGHYRNDAGAHSPELSQQPEIPRPHMRFLTRTFMMRCLIPVVSKFSIPS